MTEIFADIPEEVRIKTKLFFELAMAQPYVVDVINTLKEYIDTCTNEEEKEYADFYFNMRFEQMKGDK